MKILSRQDQLKLTSYKENLGKCSSKCAFDICLHCEEQINSSRVKKKIGSEQFWKACTEAWLEYAELLEANNE